MDIWRYIVAGVSFLACVGVAIASKEAPASPVVGFVLEPHHIVLAFLIALIVLSIGGRNLGEFFRSLTKKGSEVTVNLEPPKDGAWDHTTCPFAAGGTIQISPATCPDCKAEHERSIENKNRIGKVDGKLDALKTCFDDGFKQISKEIGDTKTEIIKALAANRR